MYSLDFGIMEIIRGKTMHIAISGRLGSGKSTVCRILNEKYGFEVYSTGKIQRRIAEEMGITTLELNRRMVGDNQLDHTIDNGVRDISRAKKDKNIIFDSRMAWHFAENCFSVYVYADPTTAAKRVMNDKRGTVENYKSVEEAREKLYARSLEENRRYKELYGVDNFDYSNYNLIIDSTIASADLIADLIYACYKKFDITKNEPTKLLLSPICMFPTLPLEKASEDTAETKIIYMHGNNFVTSGHKAVADALKNGEMIVTASIDTETTKEKADALASSLGEKGLKEYEESGMYFYQEIPNIYKKQ